VQASRSILDLLPRGAIVSLRNIAVGRLLIPGKDIQPGKKDAAVTVLHIVGDIIYNMGTKDYQAGDLSLEGLEINNIEDDEASFADEETRAYEVDIAVSEENPVPTDTPRAGSPQLLPQSTPVSQGK